MATIMELLQRIRLALDTQGNLLHKATRSGASHSQNLKNFVIISCMLKERQGQTRCITLATKLVKHSPSKKASYMPVVCLYVLTLLVCRGTVFSICWTLSTTGRVCGGPTDRSNLPDPELSPCHSSNETSASKPRIKRITKATTEGLCL